MYLDAGLGAGYEWLRLCPILAFPLHLFSAMFYSIVNWKVSHDLV